MISVLLDENNFFTGEYATTGSIVGGISVDSIPPEENQLCYKYETVEKETIRTESVKEYFYTETVPSEDETSEPVIKEVIVTEDELKTLPEDIEVSVRNKIDENGNIVTKDVTETSYVKEWVLDESKIQEQNSEELERLKVIKISELSETCKSTIYSGIDLETSIGTEHFDLTETDQINIKSLYDTVLNDPSAIVMYHSSKTMCRVFTTDEIKNVYNAAMNYVVFNTTLFNHLQSQILNMKSVDRINEITYSYNSLTGKYKENFDALMNVNS